jgi:hypothetical protein
MRGGGDLLPRQLSLETAEHSDTGPNNGPKHGQNENNREAQPPNYNGRLRRECKPQ